MNSQNKPGDIQEITSLSYKLYQLGLYEEAFSFQEELISSCLKQKNYPALFIAIFNRNLLLRILQTSFNEKRDKYLGLEEYSLRDRFNNLPKVTRQIVEPVYNFLNFSLVYKMVYDVTDELHKKEHSKKYIDDGGVVLNNETEKYHLKHRDIILFVLNNKIMLDNHLEFQLINRLYVKISLVRQSIKKTAILNKFELYSCVKYLKYEELTELFADFKGKDHKYSLEISHEEKNWLIDNVLKNVSDLALKSPERYTKFSQYLENILFVVSLTKIESEQVKTIISTVTKIINQGKNTSDIFEAINRFLGVQYILFKTEIDEQSVLNMIEILITKLVYKKLTHHEYFALSRNAIDNLYGYVQLMKAKFSNKQLVERLILELTTEYDVTQQIDIGASLLINIYHIGTDEIQSLVKDFLLKIDISAEKEEYRIFPFELMLIINNFRNLSTFFKEKLSKYLDKYKEKGFSTDLYTIKSQVEYLVVEEQVAELKEILETLNGLIERHKKNDLFSIF